MKSLLAGLGLGLGFSVLATIVLRFLSLDLTFLNAFFLLITWMGLCRIFSSLLHYMLPRKRAVEGVVLEDDTGHDLLKKHRIGCLISSSAADSAENNPTATTTTTTDENENSKTICEKNNIANNSNSNSSNNYSSSSFEVNNAMGDRNPPDIDEDLHSRQLAVYGRETMRRLFASNILAVVLTDISIEKAIEFNDYCHNHQPPIAFIKTEVRGLFGSVFCDFGPEFTVVDVDGEEPHTGIIASISNDCPALVSCVDDERLEFQDGDLVVFSEVRGMTELNDGKPRKIKNARPYSFTLEDDTTGYGTYERGGIVTQVKQPKAKSTVAASAAVSINPRLDVEALQNRVGPETENVFDDAFWENLSVVINALDNINARLYVDQRCLYFQKPLLESGTLGAKCNTQMVIPHLTENYGASRDPPEKQAPMCTVHSFPHNIDHCLTWARSEFEGLLEKTPAEVNAYLSSPGEYTSSMRNAGDAQARDNLERVIECLDKERCETFQDCVTWARLKFEDYFSNRVKQLTYTFPEDAATSTGAPFWSAPKRFPHPLQFSTSDLAHIHFVMAASILRAETFGIPIPGWAKNPKKVIEAVDKVIVPEFQPKKDVNIVIDEKATGLATASVDDAAVINELIKKLGLCTANLPAGFRMKPIQFEKDDDTNYHMDMIAGLANMRARNYSIPEVDKLKAKFIAGRIIPAIATSTAMATGLICLELYKVLDGGHKLEDYRNTFANLALPLFSMAEPVPPKVVKHQDMSWTVWDRWILEDNPTLRELLQWLKDKGLNAYSISVGSCLLYNSLIPRHKERMDKKVVDLAKEVAKVELPPYRRHLDVVVACEDDEDNDVDIPLFLVSGIFPIDFSAWMANPETSVGAKALRRLYQLLAYSRPKISDRPRES
ncbi:Ubiquitin-activating enzyme E1, FCCH domain [Dillenia turbinata]|uniref:Ubiquitin-activating enzyme E1, FCCH domain n=1 Tax=Dillenia turbinata TaxID=194707 RepID=A0AAN8VGQ3_9MAGN